MHTPSDPQKAILGPCLFLDGAENGRLLLSAIVVAPAQTHLPDLEANGLRAPFTRLAEIEHEAVFRARFAVPDDRPSTYRALGETFPVASAVAEDLRLAFVSCDGEEHGDLFRETAERNAMWARLVEDHRGAPFSLLLHGGDQIYADEVTKGHALTEGWPKSVPDTPAPEALEDLAEHLRRGFFERYTQHLRCPAFSWLAARIPSLAQWDDHDICDGWGSLPEKATRSAVGQTLFSVAREMALLFQHGTTDDDLPPKFVDRTGGHLGWVVDLPDLRLVGPDLRSERTRHQIMGQGGWTMMDSLREREPVARTMLLSSVPLLGPRLSLLETIMVAIPGMMKYEDDLRDQWQSRAHRTEWRRILGLLVDLAAQTGTDVTAVSGEIHLATRAEMALDDGRVLHQLVASGITHRAPPRAWALFLGLLSFWHEGPLPGRPIRIHRIPGQSAAYVADRNRLGLERRGGAWRAQWDFETTGPSELLLV
ncbi:alkaline phosphatase D family protein [Cognatishimia sp. F0-27]|uniref:alkaline phosphatase D family protein n=1 Tax=Cognatishimia sp. F0-27 TaxID=2816855 RepID=UPI001D0CDD18|nr:alkaline phosphatase D family protein [Cognatishimia sp. F0-27]MCC1493747.1 alkaline phosphatase family protein [Cognatishimia sp. F0-27]